MDKNLPKLPSLIEYIRTSYLDEKLRPLYTHYALPDEAISAASSDSLDALLDTTLLHDGNEIQAASTNIIVVILIVGTDDTSVMRKAA